MFGDNLQSRLNDIWASNKISETTFPERHNQGKSGLFSNKNNAVSDNRPAKIIPPVEDKLTKERKSGESVEVNTADESIFKTLQVSNLAENMPNVINYFTLKTASVKAGQL